MDDLMMARKKKGNIVENTRGARMEERVVRG